MIPVNLTVDIVMTGLILLSPQITPGADGQAMASQMTAYLVDAGAGRQAELIDENVPPSDKDDIRPEQRLIADPLGIFCVAPHQARITFDTEARNCSDAESFGCVFANSLCTCPIERKAISFLPIPTTQPQALDTVTPKALPFDDKLDNNESLSYLFNLARISQKLHPKLDCKDPPGSLLGRFTFPFEQIIACDFSTRPDDTSDNVHAFAWRPLGEKAGKGDLTQAMTQQIVARFTWPIEQVQEQPPTLRIATYDDAQKFSFPLKGTVISIRLENMRSELPVGHPCDDGIGRDFAHYYDLLETPPPWTDRPVPHVKLTQWKDVDLVEPNICERFKIPMSRPVCPMAALASLATPSSGADEQ